MPRPIVAKVDSAVLASNLSIVRRHAPQAQVWSVVKANGYGHGLNTVWQGLQQTDGFALLDLHEAVVLREKGWRGPILLLEGFFSAGGFSGYRSLSIDHSRAQRLADRGFKTDDPASAAGYLPET